ncbi:MAG: hypothetical protein Q4C51_01270 [Clostridia bacterium]|nr:hypothetical protein [Clostridia bacterium]
MKLRIGKRGSLGRGNKKIRWKLIILVVLIVATLAGGIFTYWNYHKEQLAKSEKTLIETKTLAYATDLDDSKSTLTSTEAVVHYLTNWAKTKGVKCTSDDYGNVIMDVKASKAYKKAKPTLLICNYGTDNFEGSIAPMALSLYLVKNNSETGRLRVIFTDNTGNNAEGIKSIDKDYVKGNYNIICVNGNGNNFWSTKTGSGSTYKFTKKYTTVKPTGNKAIRIYMRELPGGIPALLSSYSNPIKELSNQLASFKTNAYIYELADFHGGSNGKTLPGEASTTIVIDENDYQKFTDKLDRFVTKFLDKKQEKYPDVEVGYEEVKVPKKVIKSADADEFVSVLYTLLDGVYYKDNDDNIVSTTNIGKVYENNGVYTALACANSLDDASLDEIDTAYKTLCGLSNIKFEKTGSQKSWSVDEESTLPAEIADAFHEFSGKDLEFTETPASSIASYVSGYNKKADIICVNLNNDRLGRYTGTILTFLKNQEHKTNLAQAAL